jgi:hypothetical protein
MSNQMNEFDQVFRERLSGQTATPPPAVWDNIQSTRTYGHVVANRISTNWRIFGTLLMLLLAGGSSIVLFGEGESQKYHAIQYDFNLEDIQQPITNNAITTSSNNSTTSTVALNYNELEPNNRVQYSNIQLKEKEENNENQFPDLALVASVEASGFLRPDVENPKLSSYIENLEDWGSASPKGFTRFYELDKINAKGVNTKNIFGTPKSVNVDWDYVLPKVERKTFMERSSIFIAITPHSIYKTMRADYNLSSSFLEDRKKAENTRLAYTASVMWQYEVKKHRFIETGINYTQIYEEMSYEGEKRFSNQYNFIEIPLLLGFEDRNAKWGWHVKGGFGLQIYNTYEGYTLKRVDDFGGKEDDNRLYRRSAVKNFIVNDHRLTNNQARNEVVSLEDEAENPYKSSGVINLHFAAGITYYHSIKTSFMISPSYRQSVNSITKESALFSEKLSYMGISFGTRVKF